MRVFKVFLIVIFISTAFYGFAETAETENVSDSDSGEFVFGMVFSTGNILFDLDAYRGGIGGRFVFPDFSLIASIGGGYESGNNVFAITGSFSAVVPIIKGRVIPYWGGVFSIDFSHSGNVLGSSVYTNMLTSKIGGVLGVEFFLHEYVSIFAEYELVAGVSRSVVRQNINNNLVGDPAVNFMIGSDLGNNSSIGVTVYTKPFLSFDDNTSENK